MIAQKRTILVTGVTGKQGGATARHLLERGFSVRGLTRDPGKPAANKMKKLGVELAKGDLNDRDTLNAVLDGVYGVFSVQEPWENGLDGEVNQGKQLAEAAKAAGISHFVQASVASANHNTGIPHFETKWQIEQHLHDIDLPCTILRPVYFMQNWELPMVREALSKGQLPQPLSPDTSLQQIDVEDIGAFAAMAFADPDKWIGREFDLAGDDPTMSETAEAFSRALNKPVKYVQVPWDDFEKALGEEMTTMYRWFEQIGYTVDINACREEHPPLRTLDQYLQAHDWSALATS